MEYLLNWTVLLISLGAIVLVAVLSYFDLLRTGARPVETIKEHIYAAPAGEPIVLLNESGSFVELSYYRDGAIEHVQRVYADQTGYIGTESYPALGPGMPVRLIEILFNNNGYSCTNLDWQADVSVREEGKSEIALPMGQSMRFNNDAEFHLPEGWIIRCRVCEESTK